MGRQRTGRSQEQRDHQAALPGERHAFGPEDAGLQALPHAAVDETLAPLPVDADVLRLCGGDQALLASEGASSGGELDGHGFLRKDKGGGSR